MQKETLDKNPIQEFLKIYAAATASGEAKPDAFVLATATPDGIPSARVLLFKGIIGEHFTFYTNYQSQKGKELAENPHASMVFYWPSLGKQVRVTGRVEKTTPEESQKYWESRPRGSQLSALASPQGRVISSREELEKKRRDLEEQYKGTSIPCPSHWGGYRLIPDQIEIWIDRPDRFHDRYFYAKKRTPGQGGTFTEFWTLSLLGP